MGEPIRPEKGMDCDNAKDGRPEGAEAPERSDKLHKPDGEANEYWRSPCAHRAPPQGGKNRENL
jgi:hypothetical protein